MDSFQLPKQHLTSTAENSGLIPSRVIKNSKFVAIIGFIAQLYVLLIIICFFIRCRIDKNTFLYNDRRMETAIFITPRQAAEYLIDVGYTQARIAIESSVPQATISRIATGRHKDPRLSTAQKLLGLALKVKQGVSHMETPNGTEATESPCCPTHVESDRTGSAAFTPVANEQQSTIGR